MGKLYNIQKMEEDYYRQYRRCTGCNKNKLRKEFIKGKCLDCQPTMRTCNSCAEEKPLHKFVTRKTLKSGYTMCCRVCSNKKKRKLDSFQKRAFAGIPTNLFKQGTVEYDIYEYFWALQTILDAQQVKEIADSIKVAENPLKCLDKWQKKHGATADKYTLKTETTIKRAVIQIDLLDGREIAVYESCSEASRTLTGTGNRAAGSISAVARGIGKSALGYYWRYEEDI